MMKTYPTPFLLGIVLFATFSANVSSQQRGSKLSELDWLAGCWEMKDPKRGLQITEMWMRPAGDAMIGVGRTLKTGKLVDFEFLRIVETASGLAYISRPSGNKEDTSFPLKSSTNREVVFENPRHDFPQRILYTRSGEKLTARIEGTKDGNTTSVDFPYTRVKCHPPGD
jgi:hypothetical protein